MLKAIKKFIRAIKRQRAYWKVRKRLSEKMAPVGNAWFLLSIAGDKKGEASLAKKLLAAGKKLDSLERKMWIITRRW